MGAVFLCLLLKVQECMWTNHLASKRLKLYMRELMESALNRFRFTPSEVGTAGNNGRWTYYYKVHQS